MCRQITNVDLASRVGLSAPPCLRRVRRLEESGVLRGYHADVEPSALGFEVTFFAIVGLESQKQAVLDAFEAAKGGVCVVNGRMVDAPVIHLARKTMQRHAIASARGG